MWQSGAGSVPDPNPPEVIQHQKHMRRTICVDH
jgi:hypothetical protein